MGVKEAFLAAIIEEPENAALCQMYADWLLEQGDAREEVKNDLHSLPQQFAGTVLCQNCWAGFRPPCKQCRPVMDKQRALIAILDLLDNISPLDMRSWRRGD